MPRDRKDDLFWRFVGLNTPNRQKYQVWLEVVAREASQREIADRWGVDRSTVIKISQVAK